MNKSQASIISIIFHPLLMLTYTFIAIMVIAPPVFMPLSRDLFWHVLLVVGLTSFIIPVLLISTLRVLAVIPDFYLDNKKQRIIPFLSIAIIYGISAYMFYSQFAFTKIIFVAYFSTTLLITLLTVITLYWKISFHSASIAGMFGILYAIQLRNPDYNFLYLLSAILLTIGIVSSSRLKLNAHTLGQIIGGAVIGFTICFLIFYYFV